MWSYVPLQYLVNIKHCDFSQKKETEDLEVPTKEDMKLTNVPNIETKTPMERSSWLTYFDLKNWTK